MSSNPVNPPTHRARPRVSGLVAPVRHTQRPSPHAPLVFADVPGGAPDLAALTHRVAARLATTEPSAPVAACFGARQRWYLTRLALPPNPRAARRLLVRSQRFIGPDALAGWTEEPPPDGLPIAPDVAAVVDGSTPPGQVAFYALLEGPAPWRALPLGPLPPPFEVSGVTLGLGDADRRLTALVRRHLDNLPLAAPLHDLLAAATAWLPADHQTRRLLAEARRLAEALPKDPP